MKTIWGEYNAGFIRFLGREITSNLGVIFQDENPAMNDRVYNWSIQDSNMPVGFQSQSSGLEYLSVTNLATNVVSCNINLLPPGYTQILPVVRNRGIVVQINGGADGLQNIAIVGITVPNVLPNTTVTYVYLPVKGVVVPVIV